jgi:hypothetical protein
VSCLCPVQKCPEASDTVLLATAAPARPTLNHASVAGNTRLYAGSDPLRETRTLHYGHLAAS